MSAIGQGLPTSWTETTLDECCIIIQGQSPPGESYNTTGQGLPFFQGKAEFSDLYPTPVKWCTAPAKLAGADDILISVRAPVGPTNLCPTTACIGRGLAAIRPLGDIPPKYVLYALRHTEGNLAEKGTGSTFTAISGTDLRAHRVPLAPLREQHRVVAEIEKQFTRLDAGVSALKRVRANLKRYRAAVLKAACDGRLVPTEAELARAEDRDYEPADRLLARILRQRRAKWETEQIAKLQAEGKVPKDDKCNAKCEEPPCSSTGDSQGLPEGWVWATVAQLSTVVQYGTSSKANEGPPGVPVLRMGNIVDGRLFLDRLKFLPSGHPEFPELLLVPEDVLFNRTNSAELVGKTAVYRGAPNPCSFASYLIRVRVAQGYTPELLSYYLNSVHGRTWVASVVSQQVGQANVNGSKLQSLVVPLPPLADQTRIVAEVERRLSEIEELETIVASNLKRAARLRQALLAPAFSGRLVPQALIDEPASVLVDRIRAERALRQVPGKTTKAITATRHRRTEQR